MPTFRINFSVNTPDAEPDRLEWQTVRAESALQAVKKAMRTLDPDQAEAYLTAGVDFVAWVHEEGEMCYEDGTPLECVKLHIGVE